MQTQTNKPFNETKSEEEKEGPKKIIGDLVI